MHNALRVHETAPSATPKGGEDRRPTIPACEPAATAEDRIRQPKGQSNSGPEHAEVPPMKERPAVGGRKPLNNHLKRVEEEREDSICRRVYRTGDQQRAPGRQNSKLGTTSGRATNDLIKRQARPIVTAGRRTGHESDKEAQMQEAAFEAAPKRLNLQLKQKGTAEPLLRMQKQLQLPYTMTAPSNYRRK